MHPNKVNYRKGLPFKLLVLAIVLSVSVKPALPQKPVLKKNKVILIVLDGVRRHEIFKGTDIYHHNLLPNLKKQSREELLPFVWEDWASKTTKKNTMVYGDPNKPNDEMLINNETGISLPGYADLFSGKRQHLVTDNYFNAFFFSVLPHPTLFDLLLKNNFKPEQISVFASWGGIKNILSQDPKHPLICNCGHIEGEPKPDWYWTYGFPGYDQSTMNKLQSYLKNTQNNPDFLFLALNDSDDWAHKDNYAEYVASISRQDQYLQQIYSIIEAKEAYSSNTLYIVTADHGRGMGENFKEHNKNHYENETKFIWAIVHASNKNISVKLPSRDHFGINQLIRDTLKIK